MAKPTDSAGNVTPLRKAQPCPECGRPSTREDYPFCSDRCRSLDLARWLNGSYAIPVADDESSAENQDSRQGNSE
ncbi:DNA gyrase inhibitor YacG [Agrobacterium tumefaciens]|uniref:DNA gyrase inhibitor YacG n=1 Tax=Agrobacterium tumefaciens TaxID=358 RepID=A0A176X971_AGRTU|nr:MULTISPECIES: DNA gyrase inhibitor YacG [Agrobacterium]OAE43674.1 DNA gyrase inhibitor YacG [Agrobacterium tumefaciens]